MGPALAGRADYLATQMRRLRWPLLDMVQYLGWHKSCGSRPGVPDTTLSRSKRVTCRSQLVGETSDPHRQKF
ncbi:hypothetical protein QCD79_25830, partial [Pseudomonas quasicaspiana]|nr:hypothetical protein [Pseudomonas quasicaspiana]